MSLLKKAAERRLDGLTREQKRRHYGHAAELVAAVVASDPSPATAGWAASIREAYRRYPALCRALDRPVGKA